MKSICPHVFFLAAVCIAQTARPFTVTVDPGHGGEFTGACSVNGLVIEKDATLDVGLKLADLLRKKGFNVVMTRTTDTQLDPDLMRDLQKRVDISRGSDAFVSIHFNGPVRPTKTINGQKFELYVPYTQNFPEQSYALAARIHTQLAHAIEQHWSGKLGNLNITDGGIRRARFNVIEKTPCPAAVLVELAYITDTVGEAKIAQPAIRMRYAELLAEGINDYARAYATLKSAHKPHGTAGKNGRRAGATH